jgi:acyl-CoA thioester hydrolase
MAPKNMDKDSTPSPASASASALSGYSELRLQPRYSDTDAMGVVYYANYLVYFEVARTTALADLGHPYWEMEKQGLLIPVLRAHCEYHRPARYGDTLIVRTHRSRLGRARIRFEYSILRESEGADQIPLATGYTEHAFVNPEGKPLRPPQDLFKLFPESRIEA